VGEGLTDERLGLRHLARMLGRTESQVNESGCLQPCNSWTL
jgi:hypothetical protein